MPVRRHLFVFAVLVAAPAPLMTGCDGDATGARTTIAEVRGTSYVVEDPVTTTTTTTLPPATADGAVVDPNEQQYIVQPGDSVYRIASKFGIKPDVLANFNSWPEGINHPVFVGDIVRIPPNSQVPTEDTSDAGTTGAQPDTETTEAPTGVGCTHTVVAGDNPTRLSEKYDVTLEELNAANANNPAYSHFQLGSQINIPAGGDC